MPEPETIETIGWYTLIAYLLLAAYRLQRSASRAHRNGMRKAWNDGYDAGYKNGHARALSNPPEVPDAPRPQ